MRFRALLLASSILVGVAGLARAQSTADPVIPGFLTNTNCATSQTSCWKQYDSTNPMPVTTSGAAGNTNVNLNQVGGTSTSTAASGVAKVGIVGGAAAAIDATIAAGTAPANGIAQIGRAQSAEPAAATNGQTIGFASDLTGKQIVMLYANKENFVSGTTSSTATTSTLLVTAPAATFYLYISTLACYNSGSSSTVVAVQNGSGGTTIFNGYAPAGGGFNLSFAVPLGGSAKMTVSTGLYVAATTSTSTLFCNAVGYTGT